MIYPVNNRPKNYSGSYGYDKANRLISLDIIRVVGAKSRKWGHFREHLWAAQSAAGWLVGLVQNLPTNLCLAGHTNKTGPILNQSV